MELKRMLLLFCVALKLYFTDCLECYSCTNVSHVANCPTKTICPAGQICHTSVISNLYTLGCKDSGVTGICPVASTSTPGGGTGQIFGRALSTRLSGKCSECCNTALCNKQLCQNNDPTCHDSGNIDCAVTGSFVDVCAEQDHAKHECKRFCGLCSMVDGDWSNWSAWTTCSSSCGNGTMSKTRSCTNPPPAAGGSDCMGAAKEFNTCSNAACPVNGGWSMWSSWGSCSVTCGIGLQRRDRSCSNPYPSNSGEHCYGESRDDQICITQACQDGGWTDWDAWTTCSKTCETGTRKRSRSCTNPSPSVLGRSCTGDPSQVETCAVKSCHEQAIGFTVNDPKDLATRGHIRFINVVTNLGGGYNTTTGEFTCSLAGVYSFSLTITKHGIASAYCNIYKNSNRIGLAEVYSVAVTSGNLPGSVTVYVHLLPGDIVSTQTCTAASTIGSGMESSFTGYLVHSD